MRKGKKYLLVAMSAMLLMTTGCVKTPKLDNGQEVVAELDGKQITANDLYSELKTDYGTSILVNIIDQYIISQKLENTDAEKVKAQAYIKQMKEYYENNGYTWTDLLAQNNSTEAELIEQYTENYAKETIANNYYKEQVTDEEIQKYYDDEIIGDITAKHILISPETNDDMSDEEKKKAENDALNKAKEVIQKLNDGSNFADLAKEYSDDDSAGEGGTLAPFNKQSNYETAFINAAIALNAGEYTKTPVKTQYGYHIIYVESKADKPNLDAEKDTIITTLAQKVIDANENYQYTAWKAIRKNYNLKMYDTIIDEKYEQAMSKY